MSDRNNGGSRWSSAREREERDKQRRAEREAAKQARLEREANAKSGGSSFSDSSQRRLTDEERRTIREYRFPTASERAKAEAESASPTPPAAAPTASSLTPHEPASTGVGTRWRDSVAATGGRVGGPGGPGLPDLPGDNGGSGGKRPGNGRLLIFGIGLFAVMALVAFLPFGPFGDGGGPDIPTPSATLPSILDNDTDDEDDPNQVDPEEPQAGDGQAVVCIDPGHGGWDTGWNRTDQDEEEGPYSLPTVTEAELNLGMAYMLRDRLEELGYFVVMTRESGAAVNPFLEDINGDGQSAANADDIPEGATIDQVRARDEFQARIDFCNDAQADVLVSIHVNGITDRNVRGYEVLYTAEREFGEQNETLATLIYREMDTALRDTEMGGGLGRGSLPDTVVESVPDNDGFAQHLIMTGPAFEEGSIEPSLMPGAIIECAFLSNDLDAAWLVQTDNQQILADAYARGIDDYFEEYPAT